MAVWTGLSWLSLSTALSTATAPLVSPEKHLFQLFRAPYPSHQWMLLFSWPQRILLKLKDTSKEDSSPWKSCGPLKGTCAMEMLGTELWTPNPRSSQLLRHPKESWLAAITPSLADQCPRLLITTWQLIHLPSSFPWPKILVSLFNLPTKMRQSGAGAMAHPAPFNIGTEDSSSLRTKSTVSGLTTTTSHNIRQLLSQTLSSMEVQEIISSRHSWKHFRYHSYESPKELLYVCYFLIPSSFSSLILV